MAEFAELVKRRKQAVTPAEAASGETAIETFQGRLEQRRAEEQTRALQRQRLATETPSMRGRITEAFTGAQRATPQTEALPEFMRTEDVQSLTKRGLGTQIKLSAGLLTTLSPEGQMNVIKESIPEATFEQDEKGNIIVDVGGNKSVLNKPGMSISDVERAISTMIMFAPASKLANLGKSLLARFGIGAIGAAATEAGRQVVSGLAGSQEEISPGEIALAGGISGVAETAVPAFRALRASRAAKRAGATVPELLESSVDVARAREAVEGVAEATGVEVPLFQPQQTLVPSQLKLQRLMPQLDSTSRQAAEKLVTQNRKVAEAVDAVIETISPGEVSGAPEALRGAAQKAIETKKLIRKELSSPLFNEAKNDIVATKGVEDLIESELKFFTGKNPIKSRLETIKENIKNANKVGQLQKTKAVIDDILLKKGEGSVSGDGRRIIQKIKEELMFAMDGAGAKTVDEAVNIRSRVKRLMAQAQAGIEIPETKISGSNLPPYAQARIRFAQASPEVTALTDGIVGKLADLDNLQVENIANTIFNPRLRPETIKQAKKVLEASEPGVWNDILKFKIIDNMTKIKPPQAGAIENTAGKVRRAMFGNAAQRKTLFAGMSEEQAKNMRFIDTMLDRASQGRFEGSPTASFQEALKNIRSIPLLMQKLFTLRASEIQKVGETGLMNSRLRAVASSIFDDTWADELAAIRRLNPNSPQAATRLGKLFNNIAETAAKTSPQAIREEL